MLNSKKSYHKGFATQGATDVAQGEFAMVSHRLLLEMDRFKQEKSKDMRRTVLEYIELQVGYNQQMEKIWPRIIPVLERLDLSKDQRGVRRKIMLSREPYMRF